MKINITIFNDHGELLDIQRVFSDMNELNLFMTNQTEMHKLWCEAEKNGEEDGILGTFDSKEEAEFNKEDIN